MSNISTLEEARDYIRDLERLLIDCKNKMNEASELIDDQAKQIIELQAEIDKGNKMWDHMNKDAQRIVRIH